MGLPGAPALQRSFLRCPHVPPPVLPFPRPLLRPPRRVGAWGPVLLSLGSDVLCTRKHQRCCWVCKFSHMRSSPSSSAPWPLLKVVPWGPKGFPAFNGFCSEEHKATAFWGRILRVYIVMSMAGTGALSACPRHGAALLTILQVVGRGDQWGWLSLLLPGSPHSDQAPPERWIVRTSSVRIFHVCAPETLQCTTQLQRGAPRAFSSTGGCGTNVPRAADSTTDAFSSPQAQPLRRHAPPALPKL